MYITPAIQDFQPIHPAVYLRAADPAGPVCVVDELPIHIYSYRSPPGLFLYLKAKTKGGRAADPSLFQFTHTYRGISGMFQRYRYTLRYPGVRPRRRS